MKSIIKNRRYRYFMAGIVFFLGFAAYEAISFQIGSIDRLYKYNVRSDYNYSLDHPDISVFKVPIDGNRVQLPHTDAPWDTGFLKIHVNSDWVGRLEEPFIEIVSDGLTQRQYLERGASGIRFLNLSNFSKVPEGGSGNITLTGHHIYWKKQEADLYLFRNDPIGDGNILIIAPHPDDAEIAAFGLYSNKNAYIVTVTAGDAGEKYILRKQKYPDDASNAILKGKLRVWDSITTPFWGGVTPLHAVNLGYFDGMLEEMFANRSEDIPHKSIHTTDISVFRRYNLSDLIQDTSKTSNWRSLVNDLVYIINKTRPKIIVTPHIYFDNHRDHQLSTIALYEAISKSNFKKGKIYLYDNHHVLAEYYPFGPAHSIVSLPPWFDNSVLFRSIYSLGLSPEKQLEKLFALDAQHDLRQVPKLDDHSLRGLIRDIKNKIMDYYEINIRHEDYSVFRRAIRSDELFFVIDVKDIEPFEEKYLKNFIRSKQTTYKYN
jgi:LmbE family N-acetylglucosaminyl deacetylase